MTKENRTPNNVANGERSTGDPVDLHDLKYENHLNQTNLEPQGWQSPEGHHFQRVKVDKSFKSNPLTKVNGVEAFSKAASLYKGVGSLGEVWIDPKVDPNTGKVPAGNFNSYDYPTYRGPREQLGMTPYTGRSTQSKHPIISPEASSVETTTVNPEAIHTTWRDLRSQLGRGAGSRTNKFLLEFTIPIHDSVHPWKWNILCKAVTFPQRSMHTASMWRFGRKYNLRGETNFNDSWALTFEEDSNLSLRRDLDRWFREIDDSRLQHTALNVYSNLGNPIRRLETKQVDLFEREDTAEFSFGDFFNGAVTSLVRPEYAPALPNYQTDIRVYQLDQTGNKVMGYVMQNAFVSDIGSVDYGDDKLNELVTYPVTFTYSEFLPMKGNVLDGKIRVFE